MKKFGSSYFYADNKINKNLVLLSIHRAGITTSQTPLSVERTSYPYCLIHIVLEGSVIIDLNGRQHIAKKGDLFVLDAFRPHKYSTPPGTAWSLLWAEFSGGDSSKLVKALCKDNNIVLKSPIGLALQKNIYRILNLLESNHEDKAIYISVLIYKMLIKLIAEKNKMLKDNVNPGSRLLIQKALQYIDENIGSELSLDKLSGIVNLSPFYFSRVFHKLTGLTLTRYILEKRILRAKELLTLTDETVNSISHKVGFCDASHFIKVFKKSEGLTPAEFRRQCIVYNSVKATKIQ